MTELAHIDSDLPTLLRRAAEAGGDVAVFEALLAQVPSGTATKSRSTVATRKAEKRRAIEEFDLDKLIALQEKMASIVDTLTKNEIRWDEGTMVLSGEQAASLMGELLDEREVAEVLDVRREMIKEAVFAHLDEVEGPNHNGAIEVPEHGKKFCREGAGTGAPAVDEQRLQALLGERWLEACDEEIIPPQPERIEYRLNVEKVLDMARKDPEILEHLRTCLVPGKPKSPRFVVRDL